MKKRPDWDTTFMSIALHWALRSTCTRAQFGAVIVDDDKQIVTTGYNGAPRGLPHCLDVGCHIAGPGERCQRSIHAEENAILQAARTGRSVVDTTIYVSGPPCEADVRRIIQVGIRRVVFQGDYQSDPLGPVKLEWFKIAGVSYNRIHNEVTLGNS